MVIVVNGAPRVVRAVYNNSTYFRVKIRSKMGKLIDETGNIYGRLTVLYRVKK